jgi:TonB-dependent receptor
MTWNGEIAGHRANAVMGVRYEQTKVRSSGTQGATFINWVSDNDFFTVATAGTTDVSGRGQYSNLLPSLDFSIDVTDRLKARASFSRTLARPDFGNLFASGTAGGPPRPTALGGIASGSTQNPDLLPLLSDNFDVSVEWYYKPSSFISLGFFDKRVKNFLGTGVVNGPLFGMRDASSGAPGSRSGTALAQLRANGWSLTDINLFTYTALLVQNGGNVGAADATFGANQTGGAISSDFATTIAGQVDIAPDNNDPLFDFAVSQPINNREGKIHGFEAAWTVSYNWRAKYLLNTNQGANRNPTFVAPFGTLDANISWDINDRVAISLEGINLTSESLRQYARTKTNLVFAQELKPRFLLGARYRF